MLNIQLCHLFTDFTIILMTTIQRPLKLFYNWVHSGFIRFQLSSPRQDLHESTDRPNVLLLLCNSNHRIYTIFFIKLVFSSRLLESNRATQTQFFSWAELQVEASCATPHMKHNGSLEQSLLVWLKSSAFVASTKFEFFIHPTLVPTDTNTYFPGIDKLMKRYRIGDFLISNFLISRILLKLFNKLLFCFFMTFRNLDSDSITGFPFTPSMTPHLSDFTGFRALTTKARVILQVCFVSLGLITTASLNLRAWA